MHYIYQLRTSMTLTFLFALGACNHSDQPAPTKANEAPIGSPSRALTPVPEGGGLMQGMGQMAAMFRDAEVARALGELEDQAEAAVASDPDKAIALFVQMGPSMGESGLTAQILIPQVDSMKAAAKVNATPKRLKGLAKLEFKLGRFAAALSTFAAWQEALGDAAPTSDDVAAGCRAAACALLLKDEARHSTWKSWIELSLQRQKATEASAKHAFADKASQPLVLQDPGPRLDAPGASSWNSGSPYAPYDAGGHAFTSLHDYASPMENSGYWANTPTNGYSRTPSSGGSAAHEAALQAQQDAMLRFQQQRAGRFAALGVQVDW